MKSTVVGSLLGVALLAFVASAASAEELTVSSILTARQSGASADGIVAMINNPANAVAMTAGDIVTLRNAGVPEAILTAIWGRIPAPTPAPVPLQPDDARLTDLVRLIKSGMSESIIAEQVKQSREAYNLSVNDLLYLKQNGAQETMIAALMATSAQATAVAPAGSTAAPAELTFDGLVYVKPTFLRKDREGRLVLKGDEFSWVDNNDQSENFTFQTSGLQKVWYTCEARTPENFCYQLNFKIVKGDRYRFQDIHRDKGSNAAVTKIMEALRKYYPRIVFGAPDD